MHETFDGHRLTLLGLPQELRNLIYTDVFSSTIFGSFPMLAVCRQIYNEASGIAMRSSTLICHPSGNLKLRVATKEGLQAIEDTCKSLGFRTKQVRKVEICSCHSSVAVEVLESYVVRHLAELSSCGIELSTLTVVITSEWFEGDVLSPEHFAGLRSIAMAERLLTTSVSHPRLREVRFLCKPGHHDMFEEDLQELEEESRFGPDLGSCVVDWMDDKTELAKDAEDEPAEDKIEEELWAEDAAEKVALALAEVNMRLACGRYKSTDPSIRLTVAHSLLPEKYGSPDLLLCISDSKS